MQNFRDLKVCQKAHALTLRIYVATEDFPVVKRFGLTSQMRRAAVSLPANIAEGCVRSSDQDSSRFLYMSMGSASELEYFTLLARDLKFLADADYHAINAAAQEIKRMLAALIARLKADG